MAGFDSQVPAKAPTHTSDSPAGGNESSRPKDRHVRFGQVIDAQSGIPEPRALAPAANTIAVAVGKERIVANQAEPRPLGTASAHVAVPPSARY